MSYERSDGRGQILSKMRGMEGYRLKRIETALPGAEVLPTLAVRLGDRGLRRFLEFFTVNIRNRNTREAYSRAVLRFSAWCTEKKPWCYGDPDAEGEDRHDACPLVACCPGRVG